MSLRQVYNPPNPWAEEEREWLEAPPLAQLEVFEEEAKSFISTHDSPDLGFKHSANPYRGCSHACAYCYARPSHQYLGYGAGTDFETKIVVKTNAPKILRAEFMRPKWQGEALVLSGNTDCYQALEASYKLTRHCLEVCDEFRNPVSIITKSALIRRDIDVLSSLSKKAALHVSMSIAWADDDMARLMEPGAPSPSARFETMRALSQAGISVGVGIAPIIPGLNDGQIAEILKRAHDAGARWAFRTMLRLPAEVKDVFIHSLEERFPSHAKKVLSLIRQERGGHLNNSQFGKRMNGEGPLWEAADGIFKAMVSKLKINQLDEEAGNFAVFKNSKTFQRPGEQINLFEMN
jgi:DNA repair photolyase